jgi:autotransporter translocation and assembly factor TamB
VDVDLHGPKIKSPKIDLNAPSVDFDIKGPKVKGPDFNIKGPKIKTPKVDIPNVDFDIKGPKVKGPELDINAPDLDLNAPDIKGGIKGFFKGISGKIKAPDVHLPELNLTGPDVSLPKVEMPDLSIKGPKVDVPDINIDTQLPNVDIDLHGPKIKSPKIDLNAPSADFDIKGPKIKGPKVDFPDFDIKGPKIKTPKIDMPDVDIKGPKIKTPKVDIPDVDINLKGPDFALSAPNADFNAPDIKGGIKGFFKGISGKIKAPEVNLPDVNLTGPDLSGPKFKGPKVEKPDLSIKGPRVDVPDINIDTNMPNVDVDIKGPKIKSPKIDLNAPSLDLDIKGPKIKGPKVEGDFDLKGGAKIKGPRVDLPDVDIKGPSVKIPKVDLPHVKGGFNDIFNRIGGDINVQTGEIDVNLKPDVDFTTQFNVEQKDLFYGVDMPMTIVNNDFYWSNEYFLQSKDARLLQRSFFDQTGPSSPSVDPNFYKFGDHNILLDGDVNSAFYKNIQFDPRIHLQSKTSSSPIEFELKKAKIRKDAPQFSVNTQPGELKLSSQLHDDSDIKVQASGSRRLLSSASSATNIDAKKSATVKKSQSVLRSESADPSSRQKIDYSIPRKCFIFTRPDFDGLGIHIACDKKTRCSSYIHEVEPSSPGLKAGLRKNDYILEVNGEDAVSMDFTVLIAKIQDFIKDNNLCLTVGNDKAYKKWIKTSRSSSVGKKSKSKEDKSKK